MERYMMSGTSEKGRRRQVGSKKRQFSVLFVNPSRGTKETQREEILRTYLSLGTMASALRSKSFLKRFALRLGRREFLFGKESHYPSFHVKVTNLPSNPAMQCIGEHLEKALAQMEMQPIMICMTATSAQLDEAKEVAHVAKRLAPDALRIIGGPHVSVLPARFLNQTEYQVACVGEGVETLTEIAFSLTVSANRDLSRVSGIASKGEDGDVQLYPLREYLLTLDDYPFPSESLDLFLDDLGDKGKNGRDLVYIFAGSGCPYHCAFCAQKAIHKGRIRERGASNLFEEIKGLHEKGFRKFAMVQETFLNDEDRVERFCHLMQGSGLKVEWTIELRADQLNLSLLNRMKKAGLRFIQIGVEAGDQGLLDALGKGTRIEEMGRIRDWCEGLKINTAFYMLVGLPGQDWQSILKSALFLRDHLPYNTMTMHVAVSIAIPYPGTKIGEDGAVRLIRSNEMTLNWPDRNPEIRVNEAGEFVGDSPTETDAMSSQEIFEALVCLYDLGHFLLHARYDSSYTSPVRSKAYDFAYRMFYMIERRTIRDLIVRAQTDLGPERRNRAYFEILERDGGKELHFRDVTGLPEKGSENFTRFLSHVKFINGFHTMKCLSILNRIKWMRLCSLAWGWAGRGFERVVFETDREGLGEDLDRLLQEIDMNTLSRCLEGLDRGITERPPFLNVMKGGKLIEAFGLEFRIDEEDRAWFRFKTP